MKKGKKTCLHLQGRNVIRECQKIQEESLTLKMRVLRPFEKWATVYSAPYRNFPQEMIFQHRYDNHKYRIIYLYLQR